MFTSYLKNCACLIHSLNSAKQFHVPYPFITAQDLTTIFYENENVEIFETAYLSGAFNSSHLLVSCRLHTCSQTLLICNHSLK